MKTIVSLMASILLLGACATTDDPRQGGFFGGIHGVSSGAYDQRIREREESLQRLDAIKRELRTEQTELAFERERKQGRLDNLQRRLSRLERESAQLSGLLERRRSELSGDREKTARLRRDLDRLRQDIARTGRRADSGRPVAELEAERDRLEQEYRQLLDIYLELGQ